MMIDLCFENVLKLVSIPGGNKLFLSVRGDFLDAEFLGEKVSNYIWCFSIIIGTLLLKRPIANFLTYISSNLTARLNNAKLKQAIQGKIRRPIERILQVVLYYVAVNQLSALLSNSALHHFLNKKENADIRVADIVDHLFLFLFIICLAQLMSGILDFAYNIRVDRARTEKNTSQLQLLPLMKEMGILLIWIFSIFWILGAVFHVNIPALVAGLGVGGIAIALAGKETIENLFAAMTILSDKPFQTGDIIKIADLEGTVERIGFRSTRLRSADGSAYIIPNQKLVSENLINLSWRSTRGIKLIVQIKYGIASDKIKEMITEIKKMLKTT